MSVIPASGEFLVNTTTADSQTTSSSFFSNQQRSTQAVGIDKDGNFVVTWSSLNQDGGGWGVYAQRFNASGQKVGSEFRINTTTARDQQYASVAMNANGEFAITWSSFGVNNTVANDVFIRRYNAAGEPLIGETRVTSGTVNGTAGEQVNSSIAIDNAGNVVVTWSSFHTPDNPQDGSGYGVYVRRFNADGTSSGEIRVNTITVGNQQNSSVAVNPATGTFVVVWESPDSNGSGIFAQRFSANGTPLGSEFQINTHSNPDIDVTTDNQYSPSIGIDEDGNFIVSWTSNGGDGNLAGVYARRYGADGNPLGNPFLVNSNTLGDQQYSHVSVDPKTGGFVITWTSSTGSELDPDTETPDPNSGVYARRYNPDGSESGDAFLVNAVDPLDFNGVQEFSSVALRDGKFVVVWTDQGTLFNSDPNIYARRYTLPINRPPDSLILSSNNIAENTTNLRIGTLSSTDPDPLDTVFDYSLVSGDGDDDNDKFVVVGNELRIKTSPDYEEKPSYSVRIRTRDQAGNTFSRQFTINVVDVNEPPTDITLTSNDPAIPSGSINENVAAGSVVGTLKAIDPDIASTTFTYQLISGQGSTDNDKFEIVDNQLRIKISPDFETQASYSIRVRTRDVVGGFDFDKTFIITVNDGNDAPIITIAGTPLAYVENDGNVPIDNSLTVTDIDSPFLKRAVITLDNYVAGQDFLTFVDTNKITGEFNATTGTLTLTGNATVAEYQAALRSVTYGNTSSTPNETNRTARITVTDDGDLDSLVASRVITVKDTANAPVLGGGSGSVNFIENAVPIVIHDGLTVTDIDSNNLQSATVTITNYVKGQDSLSFSPPPGITGNFNVETGILTLTGTASVAAYQNALRSVSYSNGSENPDPTPRTIQFRANDGSGLSNQITRTVTVTPVNDAPDVSIDSDPLAYVEGVGTIPLDLNLSVDDVDSTQLTGATVKLVGGYTEGQDVLGFTPQSGITGSFDATTGILTLEGTASVEAYEAALRSVTYLNNSRNPALGDRTIEVIVTDGLDPSIPVSRTVRITPVNDAPVLAGVAEPFNYVENAPALTIGEGLIPSDIDNTTLAGASVKILNYVQGQDSLSFTTPDGVSVTGEFDTDTGILTFTGTAPIEVYQTILQSVAYSNSSDNPDVTPREIQFVVSDGAASSNPITRTVTVEAVNDEPTTSGIGDVNVNENAPPSFINLYDAFTDAEDPASALTYEIIGVTGSTLFASTAITANGQLKLEYARDAFGTGSITIRATDTGGLSVETTVTVNVAEVITQPPVVTVPADPLLYTEKAGAVAIATVVSLSDEDSTELTGASITIQNYVSGQDLLSFTAQNGITGTFNPATGVLRLTGTASLTAYEAALQSVTYTNTSPDPNLTPRRLQFSVTDGENNSEIVTRTVQITPINDAPVVEIAPGDLNYLEKAPPLIIDNGLKVTDVDNLNLQGATIAIQGYVAGEDALTVTLQGNITGGFDAATGILTLAGNASLAAYETVLRSIAYRNNSSNPNTSDRTIRFTVTDTGGLASDIAERIITVTAVNDAPTLTVSAGNVTYVENAPALAIDTGLTVTDPDNTTLQGATISITNFVAGEDALEFVNQNGITGNFNAETGILTLEGTASLDAYRDALRSITYLNSSENPNTSDRILQFVVTDGAASSTIATRVVKVTAVNDAPVVTTTGAELFYEEGEDAIAIGERLSVIDVDSPNLSRATVRLIGYLADQDQLTFTNQNGITGTFETVNGVLTLTLTGSSSLENYQAALRSIAYRNTSTDPNTTPRTLEFIAEDGLAASTVATLTLRITATDNAPIVSVTNGALSYTEDEGARPVDAAISLDDPDSTTLASATVRIRGYVKGQDLISFTPQGTITGEFDEETGVLTLTGEAAIATYEAVLRSITYTNTSPNPSTAPRTIEFRVNDGTSNSNIGSRVIEITPINTAPSVTPSTAPLQYIEGQGELALDAGLVVDDPDSTQLKSATVKLVGINPIDESLRFTTQNGITGAFDSTTGVLTLTGNASLAAYRDALRSVRYFNGSADPVTSRTVEFTVTDLEGETSTVGSRTIQITPVNTAPNIQLSSTPLNYTEGQGSVTLDGSILVTDPDSAELQGATIKIVGFDGQEVLSFTNQAGITGTFDEATGILTLTGAASLEAYRAALQTIEYRNNSENPPSSRTIEFVVTDAEGRASTVSNRFIEIQPVNTAPSIVLSSADLQYIEGSGPVTLDNELIVNDPDSTELQEATVKIVDFRASESLSFTPTNGITGSFDAETGILTLSGKASLAAYRAALRSIQYTNTSDDPPNSRLIEFTITDAEGQSSEVGRRSIQFTQINTPPTLTLSSGALPYTEGQGAITLDAGLLITDPDSLELKSAIVKINNFDGQETLSVTLQAGITGEFDAATGILTLTGEASLEAYRTVLRSLQYTNNSANPPANRTIELVVIDAGGEYSDLVSRTIEITPINTAPSVAPSSTPLAYIEGQGAVVLDAGIVVSDPDSPQLSGATVKIIGYAGQETLSISGQGNITGIFNAETGILTLSGNASPETYRNVLRTIQYTNSSTNPPANRTIEFTVTDTDGATSSIGNRVIQITPVNTAPSVVPSGTPLAYTEGQGAIALDSGLSVSDPDSSRLQGATIKIVGFDGQETLSLSDLGQSGITGNFDGNTGILTLAGEATLDVYRDVLRSLQYTNNSPNPPTSRTIEFIVIDAEGAASTAATRIIQITPVNTAPSILPSATPLSYTEGQGFLTLDSDITVNDPDSVQLKSATVKISGFVAGQESLSFTTQNGITGSFDNATGMLTLTGNAALDIYRDALRSIRYTNTNPNPPTSRTIEFTITDLEGATSTTSTRTIEITPVNTAPSVVPSTTPLAYTEGQGALALDQGLTVSDPDSTQLSSATVKINGFVTGQESFSFTEQNGITGSFNATTGVLTLTGNASLALYQAALRTVQYTNTSPNPPASRTIEFTVTDLEGATSSAGSRTIQITPVNTAPSVTPSQTALAYTERQGVLAIDQGLTVSDPDSTQLKGATVRILSFIAGQESLSFSNQSGITGSFNTTTGLLTLTGNATVDAYRNALRSVQYSNTSNNPPTNRTIEFTVTDLEGAVSSVGNRAIAITPIDNPPTVTTTSGAVSYTEGSDPIAIDTGVTLADPDSTNLASATVTIGGYVAGQDSLSFTAQPGITGNFNASTGVLELTGNAPLTAYQALLRSVAYSNSSSAPNTNNRTLQFRVNDGTSESVVATRTLQVRGVNSAPSITPSATPLTYQEGIGALAIDTNLAVSDPDSFSLSGATVAIAGYIAAEDRLAFSNQNGISGTFNTTTGVLTLTGNASLSAYQNALRSITYTNLSNNPNTADRTLQLQATDAEGLVSSLATRTLKITAIDNPPSVVTSTGARSYTEGTGAVAIDPGLTVADPDSTNLVSATITISGYVAGQDSLSFTNQSGISGTFDPATGSLTLTGQASVTAYQNALRSVQYTNSSADPNTTNRTIQFRVNDGTSDSTVATRIIQITAVNTAPSITPTAAPLPYPEKSGAIAIDANLAVIDPDSPTLSGATITIGGYVNGQDSLSFTNQNGISGTFNATTGVLTLSGSASVNAYRDALRSVQYVNSSNNPNLSDRTIQFRVTDSSGLGSAIATRTIQIQPINDAPSVTPTASLLTYVEKSGAIAIDPNLAVADPDSVNLAGATINIGGYVSGQDLLSFTNQNGISGTFNSTTGVLTLTGTASVAAYQTALRSVQYTNSSNNPNTANRTIQFRVTDSGGLESSLAARTIQIQPVNDAPSITPTSSPLSYREGDGAIAIDAGITVIDPDSPNLTSATVILDGYVAGQDSLSFTTQNGIIGSFNPTTGVLSLTGSASVAAYQDALRSIRYTNSSNAPNTGNRTLRISASDGLTTSPIATRTIQVISVNEAPIVTVTSGAIAYTEGSGTVQIDNNLTVADADNANLTGATVTIDGYVAGQDSLRFTNQNGITGSFNTNTGVLTLTGTASLAAYQTILQSVVYFNNSNNPNPANRTIRFQVTDGVEVSNLANRTIQIIPVNDAPVVTASVDAIAYVRSAGAITLDSNLVVTDPDNATLAGATLTLNGYQANQDRLNFVNQNGITGSFNTNTGVLTLTGTASVANYQAALRTITYTNSSANLDTATPRIVEITVSDGTTTSVSSRSTIQILFNRYAPVVDLNGPQAGIDSSKTYVLGSPPITVAPAVASLTDLDSEAIASLLVVISNAFNWQDEELAVNTTGTGITAVYNAPAATLRLTGNAALATYQQVLRSITYRNRAANPDMTPRVIVFMANDGDNNSELAKTILTLTSSNLTEGTPGQDQFLVTTPGTDVIHGLAGDDTVTSTLANLQQDDTIDGGEGTDTFVLTGAGDVVFVDVSSPFNQVSNATTGITTVVNFERFDFSGYSGNVVMTGGPLNDVLIGGAGHDILRGGGGNDTLVGNAGNDILDGGPGNDTLIGGLGDDLYIVDSPNDMIIETFNGGIDTVHASVDFTLNEHVENLTLTGNALVGTGNALNNIIRGNALNNRLVGGAGSDRLIGAGGNDTLVGGAGNDLLQGGAGNDILRGGAGNDRLVGGAGRDRLTGGKGRDRFHFVSAKSGLDVITDFNPREDTITIARNGFDKKLKLGRLSSGQFVLGSRATDADDRFLYNRSTGALFFDVDGSGSKAAVQIATLSNKAALSSANIVITA